MFINDDFYFVLKVVKVINILEIFINILSVIVFRLCLILFNFFFRLLEVEGLNLLFVYFVY